MTNTTYKQTEIGGIPEDWELRRLGEIGFFLSTNSLSRDKLNYEKGNIYNIHYGDIHTKFKSFFVLKRETVPFINLEVKLNNFNSCEEGDLVIADASENETDIGKGIEIGIIGQSKVLAGLHTLHFRPLKSFFTLGFLGCLWQSSCIKNQILKESQGTKVLGISSTRLKDIKIPLPPLSEQTAIAAALSDADAYIESLEQLLEKKRKVKQGAMQELLQPGEGWEVKRLGEVCEKIQDGNYGGSYPKANEFVQTGVAFLTSKAIGNTGVLNENLIDYITEAKHRELAKAHLSLHDVLFTNRGASVGTIGFVEEIISNGNIGPQLTLLRADNKVISPKFLYYSMKSDAFKSQIFGKDAGSAMSFFGIGSTMKFEISIPKSNEEQTRIATILSGMDAEIAVIGEELEKARQLKQGMMQELLTGKIRLI